MSGQAEALAEQYDIDPKEMNDVFDVLMESLIYNLKEYIVNGAPLKCSMQADEGTEQTLFYQGSKIISKPVLIADMSALQLPEDRPADDVQMHKKICMLKIPQNIQKSLIGIFLC